MRNRLLTLASLLAAAANSGGAIAAENHVDADDVGWIHPPASYAGEALTDLFHYRTPIGGGAVPSDGGDVYFGEGEWAPGAVYVGHRHPAPENYVLEGRAQWTIDGEIFLAGPGIAVYTKPNAPPNS